MTESLEQLLVRIRACTLCTDTLECGARPVLQSDTQSRILIAGQAPGIRVHKSGVPFDDPSGNTLRQWLGVSRETFYDPSQVAILPMGFCYPGKGKSGDLPPDPRCADAWRNTVLSKMTELRLTLVIGQYAQAWHWPGQFKTVTDAVRAWRGGPERALALPHPSPRNRFWLQKNPWFATDLLPIVRQRVSAALSGDS